MRSIDADELDFYFCEDKFDCQEVVENAPTVDNVRHGKWKVTNAYYCSECGGFVELYHFDNYKYCPHCGAKMDRPQEVHEPVLGTTIF